MTNIISEILKRLDELPDKRSVNVKTYMKAYRQTPKYKARKKAYYQTAKYKERKKAYMRAYYQKHKKAKET